MLFGCCGSSRTKFEGRGADAFSESYKIDAGRMLGAGTAGSVYKCTERGTKTRFACKIVIKSSQESIIECEREIEIMKKMNGCDNIISFKEKFEDPEYLFLVQELCVGGELFDQIGKDGNDHFSEADAAVIMRQVLGGVAACHSNLIVNRDLKPENFLLKNKGDISDIRMIDFGLSRFFNPGERLQTRVGTVYYTAPEVWDEDYDQACDLWSAGVIMFVSLSSSLPFNGDSDKDILRKVRKGSLVFPSPSWDTIAPDTKRFIRKLLTRTTRRRLTASEALNDPCLLKASKVES